MTKKTRTTAQDAARYFWGSREFSKAQAGETAGNAQDQSEIVMLSDSFASDGHLMIYGAEDRLEFTPVKNSRIGGTVDGARAREVILPYVLASISAKVPASMFGHLSAKYGRLFQVAASGCFFGFHAVSPDDGMEIQDGDRMDDYFNLGDICATFDAGIVSSVLRKFRVKSVEVRTPSRGAPVMRFDVLFKGARFTLNLLKCNRDSGLNSDNEDEVLESVRAWDRADVDGRARERAYAAT